MNETFKFQRNPIFPKIGFLAFLKLQRNPIFPKIGFLAFLKFISKPLVRFYDWLIGNGE
jgi:hypothetical protein